MNNKRIQDAVHNHIGEGRVFSEREENELLTKIENNQTLRPKRRWFPELLGWGLAGAAILLLLGIIGSQTGILPFSADRQPERLDTSLLKEEEIHGLENMTEEERTHFLNRQPKAYQADTVEDALKALPFHLKLPKKLPFEAGFVVNQINDWHFESNTDGKDISVDFRATNDREVILIQALDFEQEFLGEGNQSESPLEDVVLNKGIPAELKIRDKEGEILFKTKEGTQITIVFIYQDDKYNTSKVLIDLANQMIE
ncbi:hypothetical protein FZC84_15470 [Rossellomorea vietnamensis]|uniref:DUF4367 domain-containing protein n=1 Tax=Rossellomorea vietnamensis TaxID=218284 RepID=A0A5D4MA53_9BACI|nr:hypothetical protein [Rossellomorea vietnamensis]TYR98307.1 hypothetical protein FZC84_15470 [Rossellomorea vietnamensis]